jgi:hypothetical protein
MTATAIEIVETVRAAFNFSVDKFPLSGPEGMRTPHYGLFRSDNGACVGNACKARYTPHTTDDIVALVEACSTAFDGIGQVRCHFDDGHYVSIAPSKDYRLKVFGERDNVFPRVIIRAGYDGRAFLASVGLYRDLCRNLMRLNCVKGAVATIRHTSQLRGKMDELIVSFSSLRDSWQNVIAMVQNMESRPVALADFLRQVYGEPSSDTGRGATRHKNRTEAIFRRVMKERLLSGRGDMGRDFMVSAWEAFNAVQGYVQHDAVRHGSPSDLERALASLDDPAVRRAEEILAA